MKRMINCFDVVSMVIEDVKNECGSKIDNEKLETVCFNKSSLYFIAIVC